MSCPIQKNQTKQFKLLSLLLIFSWSNFLVAQCSKAGPNDASTFTTDNSNGGVYNFSNPSYAQISDNNRATASAVVGILTNNTYYLEATGFNFNIPLTASICGVEAEIERSATGLILTAAVRDNEVKLIKGGSIAGQDMAYTSDNWTGADTYKTYGSNADSWGNTLTPADVNASNFGVTISARLIALVAALPSARLNHIRMSVYYNIPLPVKLQYFNSNLTDNKVHLNWKMDYYDEKQLTIQRATDNLPWTDNKTYVLAGAGRNEEYSYDDELAVAGKYYYRLKFTTATGAYEYSAIKSVIFEPANNKKIYPNPSHSFVYITGITNMHRIIITNFTQQQITIPVEYLNNNIERLNIEILPKGIYFVQTGKLVQRFVKE